MAFISVLGQPPSLLAAEATTCRVLAPACAMGRAFRSSVSQSATVSAGW